MKIGYIRVSTEEQNPARQQALLRELGVDEIFLDKASGKNADRPELKRMLDYRHYHPDRQVHADCVRGRGRARTRIHPAAPTRRHRNRETIRQVPRPCLTAHTGQL